MLKPYDFLKLVIASSLIIAPYAKAAEHGQNGNSNSGVCNSGCFGNNGNGLGNSGPGNQGNDSLHGSAGGDRPGTTGGSTGGDSTTGGSSGGDSTTGGSSGGDSTTGGSSGGDSTTGGSSGGDSTTGGSSGGDSTTGGSSGGDSTTGGSSGGDSTTGGSDGGDSGNDDNTDDDSSNNNNQNSNTQSNAEQNKLKVKLLPLIFGNYDIQNRIVNLTNAEKSNFITLDEYREGFKVNQIRMWEAGLGVLPVLYFQNASGINSLFAGLVGLGVTKNKYVQYERLVQNESDVDNLNVLPLPLKKEQLDLYKKDEAVYFENSGGILFFAGPSLAGAFAGGSIVAEGGFKTLIVKTGEQKAFVQLITTDLKGASGFTGLVVTKIDKSRMKMLDTGLNFEFDFTKGDHVVSAYQSMIAGDVRPAQELAANEIISGVREISKFDTQELRTNFGRFVGVPMLATFNWNTQSIAGQTATIENANKTKTELDYGIYFKESKGRFLHKHRRLFRAFYATLGVEKDAKEKVIATDSNMKLLWNFEGDASNSEKLRAVIRKLQSDLTIKASFNPNTLSGENLGYVNLEAKAVLPASYALKLVETIHADAEALQKQALKVIDTLIARGDANSMCNLDVENLAVMKEKCRTKLARRVNSSLRNVSKILMSLTDQKSNADYVKKQAELGKEIIGSPLVLNTLMSLDSKCELSYKLTLEGRRISRITKSIPANINCR